VLSIAASETMIADMKVSCGIRRIIMHVAIAGVASTLSAGFAPARAQSQTAPPSFTAEQAAEGQKAYQTNCQDCHGSALDNGEFGGPPLRGGYFHQHWGSGTVDALFDYLRVAMPPDRPGRLSPGTYADLTAFLLSENGYTPNGSELPAEDGAMRNMTLQK
jgi:S-disulfanyl-L-cysteine oxidoreductase SoxD